jgi:hypothetical protein
MVEKDFQTDLAKGLKAQGVWAMKWPDSAYGVVKPFDLCVAYGHQFVPIEVKLKKLNRKKPIDGEDKVVSAADFEGNQIPELRRIYQSNCGFPRVAAFIMREHLGLVREKRGWIVGIMHFVQKTEWTVKEFEEHNNVEELIWVPKPIAGWTVPGYPHPDR